MGRRIKARGNLTLSFIPSKQALADQIVFHIGTGSKLWNVRIQCTMHNGTENWWGYLSIRNGECISIGYNCKLEHIYLSIPQVTSGLKQNNKSRRKNQDQFSILARNSSGQYTSGLQNDRISKSPVTEIHWKNEILAEWNWTRKNWPTILIYATLVTAFLAWIISAIHAMVTRRMGWAKHSPYVTLWKDVISTQF